MITPKTTVKRDAGPPSEAARHAAVALHALACDPKDPGTWTAQNLKVHELTQLLLVTAGQFNQGEAPPERVLGALMSAAAWILKRHPIPENPPERYS